MDLSTIGLCLRSPPPLIGGVRKDCTKRFFIYPSLSCNIYGGRIAANSVSSRAKRCHSWPNRAATTRPPESIRLMPKGAKGEDFSFVEEDLTNRTSRNAVDALRLAVLVSFLFLVKLNVVMWSIASFHSVVTPVALISTLLLLQSLAIYLSLLWLKASEAN